MGTVKISVHSGQDKIGRPIKASYIETRTPYKPKIDVFLQKIVKFTLRIERVSVKEKVNAIQYVNAV